MTRTVENTSWGWIFKKLLIKILKFIFDIFKKILWLIFYILIWGIRYFMFYLNKLIYTVFRLHEIETIMVHKELQDTDYVALNRHEVRFTKTDEYVKMWREFTKFTIAIKLEDDYKTELMEYVKILITEAERGAFKISFDYLKNKKNLEPSFENMLLEKAIEEKKNEQQKFWNPYSTSLVNELRHKREKKADDERIKKLKENGALYR